VRESSTFTLDFLIAVVDAKAKEVFVMGAFLICNDGGTAFGVWNADV